jgi:hypothetical protein
VELLLDKFALLLKLKLNQQISDKMLALINTREYLTKINRLDCESRKKNEFDPEKQERD